MKTLLVSLFSVVAVAAMSDVAVPNTFVDSAIIEAADFNQNFDTLEARINGNKDTVEVKFVRFADLESGDSTLDSLRATQFVITDSGYIDTLASARAYLTRITGADLIVSDTARCTTMVTQQLAVSDSAYIDTLAGARAYLTRITGGDIVITDTVSGATLVGTMLSVSDSAFIDTLSVNVMSSLVSLNVTDSAYIDTLTSARAYLTRTTGADLVVTDTVQGVTVYGSTTVSGATLSGTDLTVSDSGYIDTLTSARAYLTRITGADLIVSDTARCTTSVANAMTVNDSAYIDTLTSARAYLTRITGADLIVSDTAQCTTMVSQQLRVSDSAYIDTLTSSRAYLTRTTGADIVVTDTVQGVTVYGSTTVSGATLSGTNLTVSDSGYIDTLTSDRAYLTSISGTSLTISDSAYIDTLTSAKANITVADLAYSPIDSLRIDKSLIFGDINEAGYDSASNDTLYIPTCAVFVTQGATNDTVNYIIGGSDNQMVLITNGSGTMVLRDTEWGGGGGNLYLNGNFLSDNQWEDWILLYKFFQVGNAWVEICRSRN